MKWLKKGKRTSESGVASIEMGFVLPVLLLMFLGAVDFGRVFYHAVTVANAARAGVSYGSLDAARSEDLDMIRQVAEEEAQNISGVSVAVERYCECDDGSSVACDSECDEDEQPRIYVKVNVQKTYKTILDYPGIPHSLDLDHEAIMRAR